MFVFKHDDDDLWAVIFFALLTWATKGTFFVWIFGFITLMGIVVIIDKIIRFLKKLMYLIK